MPYAIDKPEDLPPAVRRLPPAAREIWVAVFNAALSRSGREDYAFAAAWAAVKRKFRRDAKGNWHPKEVEANMGATGAMGAIGAMETTGGTGARESPQFFLVDLRAQEHEVTYTRHPEGGYLVRGLPVLRPGRWRGVNFDLGALRRIAENARRARAELGYRPPLRPFHVAPGERVDVRHDLLGVLEDIYLDGEVLKADARVFDEEVVRAMAAGRFPYLSGEFGIDSTGTPVDIRGLAFVDAPEVKGLPWRLVMNREDFPEDSPEDSPEDLPEDLPEGLREDVPDDLVAFAEADEGEPDDASVLPPECFLIVGDRDKSSTWRLPYRNADHSSERTDRWGRVLRYTKAGPICCRRVRAIAAALRGARGSKIRSEDLPPEAVRKLQAAAKACGIASEVIESLGEASSKGGDKAKMKVKVLPQLHQLFQRDQRQRREGREAALDDAETVALLEHRPEEESYSLDDLQVALEEERRARQEAEKRLSGIERQLRAERARATAQELLSARRILPAQVPTLTALLEALSGQIATVTLQESDQERTEQVGLDDLLVRMLREGAEVSERYFGQMSTPHPPGMAPEQISQKVERMAAAAGVPTRS